MGRGRVSKERWAALNARAAAIRCNIERPLSWPEGTFPSYHHWVLVSITGNQYAKTLDDIEALIAGREAAKQPTTVAEVGDGAPPIQG